MIPLTAFLASPDTLRIQFRYDADTVAEIKTIAGARWQPEGRYWTVPLFKLDSLCALFGERLALHPDVANAYIAPIVAKPRGKRKGAQGVDTQQVAPKPQDGGDFGHSGATGTPTKYDEMLAKNLPGVGDCGK